METRTVKYKTLASTKYNHEFKHGELIFNPTIGHDDLFTVAANFKLAIPKLYIDDFTEEIKALIQKYAT